MLPNDFNSNYSCQKQKLAMVQGTTLCLHDTETHCTISNEQVE